MHISKTCKHVIPDIIVFLAPKKKSIKDGIVLEDAKISVFDISWKPPSPPDKVVPLLFPCLAWFF